MNTISFSDLKRQRVADVDGLLPIIVTSEGEEKWVLEKMGDCIPTSDLHPMMKAKLNGLWNLARQGQTREKIWREK